MKTAIVMLSDPKEGSDESLGRLFNGLAAAFDYKTAGKEVAIVFQGTATRWPEVLQHEDHPAHEFFKAVEDKILGISCACTDAFGANPLGLKLIKDNPVIQTTGLPSLSNLQDQGFSVLTF